LASELETAGPDYVNHFLTLVRRARGLPESIVVTKPRLTKKDEWPFEVWQLEVDALIVDHDYQRPVSWPFVRRIAQSFDETLVGTIDVAERHADVVYAILDGQLRFEAMKLVGKTTVWASVYKGLSKQAEARFFIHKNRDKKEMHPFYTYRALLAAGDEETVEIEKLVKRLGY